MYKHTKTLFLLCETPLHAGSGSDLGLIDLPIQRERHTCFPKVEGSSLKGALREAFEKSKKGNNGSDRQHEIKVHRFFGFDETNAPEDVYKEANTHFYAKENREFRGCIAVTDCRLLLFPVKSQKGVCAWITCPRVVTKFINEMKQIGHPADGVADLAPNTASSKNTLIGDKVGIEEFIYDGIRQDDDTKIFAEYVAKQFFTKGDYMYDLIKNNVVVLPDNEFAQLTELCTEVITRTKINNTTGTVAKGQLFNEEYLPQESILYSLVLFENEFKKGGSPADEIEKFYTEHLPQHFQLGGNATIGKGIVKTNLTPPKS